MLDVFKSNAFGTVSLTDAFLKKPYQPRRLGALGYFRESGIPNTTAVVEYKNKQLSLITSSPRGGPGTVLGAAKRTAKSFLIPHFEREAKIMADEVQGLRAFGAENDQASVQALVDDRMAELRPMHETTLEYLRMGAIQGIILDGDGATQLFNLFTEFGITQQTLNIVLSSATTDVRGKCVAIARLSESALGGDMVTGYRGFCGDAFFDALVGQATVQTSLQYQESKLLRTDLRSGFEFGGIVWENYRGSVGGVNFIDTNTAYVVPEGTSIFRTYFAPADFIEAVNTIGLPLYAKLVVDDELQRWVKMHTQSNPLAMCLRPDAVIKITKS
jgi:hypothetical protein